MRTKKEKIVVGLSGGVDSSTALFLLKKQGFEPIGVTLKFFTGKKFLPSNKTIVKIKKLTQKLETPFFLLEERELFQREVINYFLKERRNLRTPNPCLICNRYFKLKKIFEFAKEKKIKYIASGHYAQIKEGKLFQAKDKEKDQSYFLSLLPKGWLKKMVLPLGELKKPEVIKIAKENSFFSLTEKESQDLCFLLKKEKGKFLEKFFVTKKGEVKEKNSQKRISFHFGLWHFDLFQRKGIGASRGPWYVIGFDKKENVVWVSKDRKDLFFKKIIVFPCHFFEKPEKKSFFAEVKIRSRQKPQKAKISFLENKKLAIVFEKPIFAPTPGQFAVFYQKDLCLGSGRIISIE